MLEEKRSSCDSPWSVQWDFVSKESRVVLYVVVLCLGTVFRCEEFHFGLFKAKGNLGKCLPQCALSARNCSVSSVSSGSGEFTAVMSESVCN